MTTVWLPGWQVDSRREVVTVGDVVHWTTSTTQLDRAWLRPVAGDAVADAVDTAYEGHVLDRCDGEVRGRVVRLAAVQCRYAEEVPGARTFVPVPGTWHRQEVRSTDGWVVERRGLRLLGYVVDVLADAEESPARGSG